MNVGVRELKAHLSAYLKRAAAGEHITVTDHGAPIAVLGPVLGHVDLDGAVAEGWVQPAIRTGLGPVKRHPSRGSIERSLAEDRSE